MSFVFRAAAVLVAFAQFVPPVQAANTAEGDLGRRLDAYFSRVVPFGFSGSVLVARNGAVVLDGGYGEAVRFAGIPNTPETVFSTGSLTKQFTAAAILKLEAMGRLSTGDTLGAFFDRVPDDKKGVTLYHLLTHTAGLPGASGFDFDEAQRDGTVRRILDAPLRFEPGTEMSYSNCGYTLLAAVIERVSETSYEAFLRRELFEPSRMEWTGYRLPDWDERTVAHNYVGDTDNGRHLDRPYPYWNLIGNGGILSTTGDMYRWYLALQGEAVLPAAAKEKLWTPYRDDYACGWDVVELEGGGTKIRHDGGSRMGNSAVVTWLVEDDVVAVIFCNQSYGQNPLFEIIEEKVLAIIDGETFEVPATRPAGEWDAGALRRYEGTYELPGGGVIEAAVVNGALQLAASEQVAIDALLFPGEETANPELNDRARALFEAAISVDGELFEAELGGGDRARRFQRAVERQVRRVERMTGEAVTGVVIVGTVPYMVPGTVATGLRFLTASGERGRSSLIWRDGRVTGLDMLMFRPAVPFAPAAGAEEGIFAGYHLVWARSFEARFRGEGGMVTGLVLGGDQVASRVR